MSANGNGNGRLQGALFDLNGTVVDDMAHHGVAWVTVARRLGREVPASAFVRDWAGQKNEEIFERLSERPLTPEEMHALVEEKERLYRASYEPHVAPVAGFPALLEGARRAGMRVALATAAPKQNRALVLDALALNDAFDAIVGAEQVTRGKPAPDIFLAAAKAIGVEPARCVVFEDALNGIAAALAAGMIAVGVSTVVPAEDLSRAGARWVIRDYEALPEELLALMGVRA